MAEPDEVVNLAKEILQELLTHDTNASAVFWSHFLTHTNDLRRLLKKRLTRDNWSNVFRSIESERLLHISIAGRCPSGTLLGLFVWLCESQCYDCDILCSLQRLTHDRAVQLVHKALKDKEWSLKLKSMSDHFTDLRFDGPGLDLLIIAHPEKEGDWREALDYVRRDGCVVLIDNCRARSFSKIERTDGFEYASPVVMDSLPCGLTWFDDEERAAIESMRDDLAIMESELPLSDEDAFATLYVKTAESFVDTASRAPTDSWEKYDTSGHASVADTVQWNGGWTQEVDRCSVPRSFLFSTLRFSETVEADDGYPEYYKRLESRCFPSRMELEGMGRPMMSGLYRDVRGRDASTRTMTNGVVDELDSSQNGSV